MNVAHRLDPIRQIDDELQDPITFERLTHAVRFECKHLYNESSALNVLSHPDARGQAHCSLCRRVVKRYEEAPTVSHIAEILERNPQLFDSAIRTKVPRAQDPTSVASTHLSPAVPYPRTPAVSQLSRGESRPPLPRPHGYHVVHEHQDQSCWSRFFKC